MSKVGKHRWNFSLKYVTISNVLPRSYMRHWRSDANYKANSRRCDAFWNSERNTPCTLGYLQQWRGLRVCNTSSNNFYTLSYNVIAVTMLLVLNFLKKTSLIKLAQFWKIDLSRTFQYRTSNGANTVPNSNLRHVCVYWWQPARINED
jgi:hypothetical protein